MASNGRQPEDTTYNGWANRATWNVALWLQNDWDTELTEWVRCKDIKDGESLCAAVEHAIVELDLRGWYLQPPKGVEPHQFFTPDGERFSEADWDELFTFLIEEPRAERESE